MCDIFNYVYIFFKYTKLKKKINAVLNIFKTAKYLLQEESAKKRLLDLKRGVQELSYERSYMCHPSTNQSIYSQVPVDTFDLKSCLKHWSHESLTD